MIELSRTAGPTLRPGWTPPSPLELTLAALGGPFRPLIVWALFWGARSFSELMRHVPAVTKKALRRELAHLERLGLVRREVRPDSNRRAAYSLSPLGQTLRPVVGSMYEWGLLRLRLERGARRLPVAAEALGPVPGPPPAASPRP
jgi:DNA-binding HxlR family transcriptional regulator